MPRSADKGDHASCWKAGAGCVLQCKRHFLCHCVHHKHHVRTHLRPQVVCVLQVHVLLEGMRFSDLTASALLHAAGQGKLPFWVGSALHIPQHYALKPGQYYRDSRAWGASLRARAAALWGGDSVRDVSDHQWREFRGSLPQLVAGLGAWVVLSRVVGA
jgi:hypothetical protein